MLRGYLLSSAQPIPIPRHQLLLAPVVVIVVVVVAVVVVAVVVALAVADAASGSSRGGRGVIEPYVQAVNLNTKGAEELGEDAPALRRLEFLDARVLLSSQRRTSVLYCKLCRKLYCIVKCIEL